MTGSISRRWVRSQSHLRKKNPGAAIETLYSFRAKLSFCHGGRSYKVGRQAFWLLSTVSDRTGADWAPCPASLQQNKGRDLQI